MKRGAIILLVIIIVLAVIIWYFSSPSYTPEVKNGECDVCKYARKDSSHKLTEYCPTCNAWICDHCRPNLPLRAKAMAMRKLSTN